jgi:hypothetical protein
VLVEEEMAGHGSLEQQQRHGQDGVLGSVSSMVSGETRKMRKQVREEQR